MRNNETTGRGTLLRNQSSSMISESEAAAQSRKMLSGRKEGSQGGSNIRASLSQLPSGNQLTVEAAAANDKKKKQKNSGAASKKISRTTTSHKLK